MNKRQFLGATALVPLAATAGGKAAAASRGPVLLTVTGAITRSNRGPLDPALDQMMHKQQIASSVPARSTSPSWRGCPHARSARRWNMTARLMRCAGPCWRMCWRKPA